LTVEVQNIPISNIPNPVFTSQSSAGTTDNSSDPANATVSLAPGEGGRVTLRVFGPLVTSNDPTTAVKTIAVAGGANTGQTTAAASLTIVNVEMPVAVVGTQYSSTLQSVGGVGTKIWSKTGELPAQLTFNPNGLISGPVTAAPSPYTFTVQVHDSATGLPNNQTNTDIQGLTLNVNRLSIASIIAVTTDNQPTDLKSGDTATIRVVVSNEGPASASAVMASSLVLNLSATGGGPMPSVVCSAATPATALVPGNTSQEFDYTCGQATGNGYVSFTATASGQYVNSAATVPVTTAPATSNALRVH
jgi:hypothetical protein